MKRTNVVSEDEEHSENQEWSVLHEDGHDDTEHVRGTAVVRLLAWSISPGLGGSEDQSELKDAPRPNGQYDRAEVCIVFYLLIAVQKKFLNELV